MVEKKASFSTKDWHRIGDPRAAQVLAHRDQLKYLRPFLGSALSASQAARSAGVRLDTMLYQIERLSELGLLKGLPLSSGPGRKVKRYQAVGDRFILPFTALQAETLLALFMHHDSQRREEFGRGLIQAVVGEGGGWHVRMYQQANGSLNWEAAPDHDPDWRQEDLLKSEASAAWYTNVTVGLTPQEAKALQQDLVQLYMTHVMRAAGRDSSSTNKARYTLQLGLAPVQDVTASER
ncbi:hypothetical protein K7W42_18795 [Deinococcus sp. HMF7604]|uniref:hypothetical protein n=1 Tax=Deinococcus betulae TaxID=2873312 RepID=UPI001CCDB39A|nr:hypothetical protein [Deinococcus betulae]MBZ9752891.1 hypothetical protein [Deinococcus betulae]